MAIILENNKKALLIAEPNYIEGAPCLMAGRDEIDGTPCLVGKRNGADGILARLLGEMRLTVRS